MANKRLVRSQAAHERCLRILGRKPSTHNNRVKRIYHHEILERQGFGKRVLSRDERRRVFRETEKECSRRAVFRDGGWYEK